MVKISDSVMAQAVIETAIEYGEEREVFDHAHERPHGEAVYETDWGLADLDPNKCDVDVIDRLKKEKVVVTGSVDAHYQVKVRSATYNPPGKAHPAEYEDREMELLVLIEAPLDEPGLGVPQIDAEPL